MKNKKNYQQPEILLLNISPIDVLTVSITAFNSSEGDDVQGAYSLKWWGNN